MKEIEDAVKVGLTKKCIMDNVYLAIGLQSVIKEAKAEALYLMFK